MSDFETTLGRAADFLRAIPGATEKAAAAALTRAAAVGRDTAIASILGRYAAKTSDVRAAVSTRAARPENLTAEIIARSSSIPLGYFPHTPTEIGTGGRGRPTLRVEVLRGSMRDVRGAFVAPIGGKPRIMIRTGGSSSSGRAQIKPVQAVPIAVMMNHESVREATERRALEVFDEQLGKQIDRALSRVA